ncbi:MAG: hypothetical protein A3H42_03270 [Deltaproteobacteria bacterium RIFCSPLOWO2_02_FULL_46_8]|nr:MAG: hypothetical protein A3H42_03270 [Deltaproteobacteria bacterium RIFCSPLOWO2_02_FULL_46_8]
MKNPDDPREWSLLGKALFRGLPEIFNHVFRHLFSISPQLYMDVIGLATTIALQEKEKSPDMQLTDRWQKSLEAAFHHFDREVLYHDIFHHYRPWDWSEGYLEAGYVLYHMMPETPDHYGLRVVGWRDFEGKKFMVNSEEREKILKGERTLHVFERVPSTTVTIHLPEKLTPGQLRWIPPYEQTDPEVWKMVETFYLDPTMTVCASIYEEAYAMATRQINPDATLLQMIINILKTPSPPVKENVKRAMVSAYRNFIFQHPSVDVERLKKATVKIQQSRFVIDMPATGASVSKWDQFVRDRKKWLAENHYLGYDRQLDEGYEGAYKASVREAVSFDDRRTALSEWLGFLSESIRLADIVGMLQVDPAWANSYADRYLAVSKELERLYVEAGRQADVDQLIEDCFNLIHQKMISAAPASDIKALEKWSLYQNKWYSEAPDILLKRRAEVLVKATLTVSGEMPSPRNEREYSILLSDAFGFASGIAWNEWRADPEFRKVDSLNTPRKFGAFYSKVCDRYLVLTRMDVYQSENPFVLWLVAIRQIFGRTLPALENVIRSSRTAMLLSLYKGKWEPSFEENLLPRDFPDLRIGKLRYNERPPTTSPAP